MWTFTLLVPPPKKCEIWEIFFSHSNWNMFWWKVFSKEYIFSLRNPEILKKFQGFPLRCQKWKKKDKKKCKNDLILSWPPPPSVKFHTFFYLSEIFPNWMGRVGLNPNMYDVTLFSLFFIEGFPKGYVINPCIFLVSKSGILMLRSMHNSRY